MRIIVALLLMTPLLMASLAAPAWAQSKGHRDKTAAAAPENAAKKKADEEAYQRALKSIPEPKGKIDPWSGAR